MRPCARCGLPMSDAGGPCGQTTHAPDTCVRMLHEVVAGLFNKALEAWRAIDDDDDAPSGVCVLPTDDVGRPLSRGELAAAQRQELERFRQTYFHVPAGPTAVH